MFFMAGKPTSIVMIDMPAQKGFANNQKTKKRMRHNKKNGRAKVNRPKNHQCEGLKNFAPAPAIKRNAIRIFKAIDSFLVNVRNGFAIKNKRFSIGW